ncbi:type II toxin-antitoxin system HicA family toxin [Flagellimonas algicola]|uniref:Type II toxin-antitoxin system HicA family toxin n=1 Tax=Flagellimonas algicola TaxID=2583815 RepID=A0ABY2WKE0_9FLAO|nr:type II toxin-antitoxin system HicA family toxin [Allomuricauda algicola]TMU54996.1 type II toxin-antitoxin system HicA family toxin [Allomuricauda algicola]
MSRIDKLIEKFKSVPKDFTWEELIKILAHFGYHEIRKKGKTGGSRMKFSNGDKEIINLHKPHPGNIVKQYAIRQVLEKLNL